jgi:hypothetical protein
VWGLVPENNTPKSQEAALMRHAETCDGESRNRANALFYGIDGVLTQQSVIEVSGAVDGHACASERDSNSCV